MVYVSLVNNTGKKNRSIALSMGLQYMIFFQNRKHDQACENENMESTIGNAKKITSPSLLSTTSGTSIGSHLGSSTAIAMITHHSHNHSSSGALVDFLSVSNGQCNQGSIQYNISDKSSRYANPNNNAKRGLNKKQKKNEWSKCEILVL